MNELLRLKEEKLRRIYRTDPCLYAERVLKVNWTDKQKAVARALVEDRRVMVKASHSVGKTMLAGGLVNWFFDCFDPGLVLTTAPTAAQVSDLLWKEVRVQRRGRPGLLPKAPRMELAPDHFAAGYTANDAESFQGRHESAVLIIFDEAVGVESVFWTAAEGMLTGDNCYWLTIFNPTTTSCKAFEEEQSGSWKVFTVAGLDHPNIAAELAGETAPYPSAVRLGWIEDRIRAWCLPVLATDPGQAGDFEFPPGSGKRYRPGPLFEARVLGRWPRVGSRSVWSEVLWDQTLVQRPVSAGHLQIGCDVARYGDDFTSIHVRRGSTSLHHETHNGWSIVQTAHRIIQLTKMFGGKLEDVVIAVDDDGVGGGVTDILESEGLNVYAVSAGSSAIEKLEYPNKRSELWFTTAELAAEGLIDFSRLDPETLINLRRQAMAPSWSIDSKSRRVVEPKDSTKKQIGRSPDDMDGVNLAYCGIAEVDSAFYPIYEPPANSEIYAYQPRI